MLLNNSRPGLLNVLKARRWQIKIPPFGRACGMEYCYSVGKWASRYRARAVICNNLEIESSSVDTSCLLLHSWVNNYLHISDSSCAGSGLLSCYSLSHSNFPLAPPPSSSLSPFGHRRTTHGARRTAYGIAINANTFILRTIAQQGPDIVSCHGLYEVPQHLSSELDTPPATSGATPPAIQGGSSICHKPVQECSM